jgi:NADPH-dependent curcumin reductase CurA
MKFDDIVRKYKKPLEAVADNIIKRFLIDNDKKEEIVRIGLQAIYESDKKGIHNVREVVQNAMVLFIKSHCNDYNEEFIDAYRRSPIKTKINAFKILINGFQNIPDSFRIVFGQLFSYSNIENPQTFTRAEGEMLGIGREFGRMKKIDAGIKNHG